MRITLPHGSWWPATLRLPAASGDTHTVQVLHKPLPHASLGTVAKLAGVSSSTVSRVLNDDPRISSATRSKVLQAVRKSGYEKNVEVSELMRAFRVTGRAPRRGTIAFLANEPEELHANYEFYPQMLAGVRERAERIGYRVDIFWTHRPGYSLRRLGLILEARGISGVILGPLPARASMDEFPWERFSAVTYGYMLESPHLHRVQNDMYENMAQILARFEANGHRRIGFITHHDVEIRLGRLAEAYYEIWKKKLPAHLRVPILEIDANNEHHVGAWVEKHRLDAVVSQVGWIADRVKDALRARKPSAEFAWLATEVHTPAISGMQPRHETIGAVCLDMVATMIAHGETGIPKDPQTILIPGIWREGVGDAS